MYADGQCAKQNEKICMGLRRKHVKRKKFQQRNYYRAGERTRPIRCSVRYNICVHHAAYIVFNSTDHWIVENICMRNLRVKSLLYIVLKIQIISQRKNEQ